jgi:hypothetical protein
MYMHRYARLLQVSRYVNISLNDIDYDIQYQLEFRLNDEENISYSIEGYSLDEVPSSIINICENISSELALIILNDKKRKKGR